MVVPVTPTSVTPSRHVPSEAARHEIARTTWYDFAALLLFFVGLFNAIHGIAAIGGSRYVADGRVLFADLRTWGIFFLCWGILQMVAAFAVYRGARWAVIVAIVTAFINAIAQLSASSTNPVWSVTLVVFDVLIMYGLIVQARRPFEPLEA
jgi:hypothetical protein